MKLVPLILALLLCFHVTAQAIEQVDGRASLLGRPGAESQPLSEVFTAGFGDSIWSFYYTEDEGLGGVEFDGTYFYVAGNNDGGDSNMIYVFDRYGKYVREFPQKSRNIDICGFRSMSTTHSGACRPPIPEHADHSFRSMPTTHSGACRPPVPEHADHPFRSMPTT
jgi:hypothetical protein